jgi:hypothetical protein
MRLTISEDTLVRHLVMDDTNVNGLRSAFG